MMLLLKFLMGGFAVLLATWISQRLGGRTGGLLAGFPAVLTAALVVVALSSPAHTDRVLGQTIAGTATSLVGALAVALLAPRLFKKTGFVSGWLILLSFWGAVSLGTSLLIHV